MESKYQTFLEKISYKNNISMKDAVKKVDHCFKKVSLETGIELSKIIKIFYKYLNPVHDKQCALLDPEECIDSLYCTPFENECIPIYVKDYIDWVLSPAGQAIVAKAGYVPAASMQ